MATILSIGRAFEELPFVRFVDFRKSPPRPKSAPCRLRQETLDHELLVLEQWDVRRRQSRRARQGNRLADDRRQAA